MNIKKPLLRWSVAVLAVLTLTACGSTTSSPTSAPTTSAPTTSAPTTENPAVQKAQTGQVTFAVQFPQAALKKALMDDRTASINVQWYSYYPYYSSGSTLLTPDPVTGVATATLDVPVGTAYFSAIAIDSSGTELDRTSTAGEITAGSNTVYLTFLGGDWQFVGADDNPLPQSFSDGTTTTTLAGFNLTSQVFFAGPTKASIDLGKPSNWNEYQLQWHDSTPAAIGPMMWADQGAQFNAPAATGSSFGSDSLNITNPSRSDVNVYVQGDRLVWIMNWVDGDGPGTITDAANNDLIPAFRTAGDSQVLDSNHIGGHLMAATFESYAEANINTNVDCQAFWFAQQATPAAARAAAIKASLTQAASKAAVGDETTLTAGTATMNYAECNTDYNATKIDVDGDGDKLSEPLNYDANGNGRYDAGDYFYDNDFDGHWDYAYYPGTSYDVTEQYSNIVAREFRAKGSQLGSLYTPPAPPAPPAVSAVGTWMKIDPVSNEVAILAFPDSSNYLMGEDGVADIGGGPGVEVGTYNFDTATSQTTFNVTYETNGDWGPATVGVPTTYPVLGLTESTLTVADPIDGTPFSFNRITSDPMNPIIGSWYFTGTGMGSTILVLLNDNKYYAVRVDAADSNNRFFESGTYTWDGFTITGTFAGTGVFSSSTVNSAIAAPGATNTLMINISGNTLTLSDVNGTYTATRL